MTYLQAALTILAHAEYPLTIGELTAVAVADGLVRPRGHTPDRTMASVLYRRMAADADAPIVSRGGRFWLRGRPLPTEEQGYLAQRARRSRSAGHRTLSSDRRSLARRATALPPPPLHLPADVLATVAAGRDAAPAPTRRERALVRAGARAAGLLARLESRRAGGAGWDAAWTDTRLVAPLLAHLCYRRGKEALRLAHAGRGATGYVLSANGQPVMALLVRRLGHALHDDDAWRALGQAREAAAPYAAVTNGQELRVYAQALAEAHDDPAAALIVSLDLSTGLDGETKRAQEAALWLLSRAAVADGALDAYAADRAVGAALLDSLDAPDSPLARALVADVRARTGLALPTEAVLRHARLVLLGRRGRDGEPAVEDVATIAGVRGPRLARPALPLAKIVRSA